jgi:hypothetical protein
MAQRPDRVDGSAGGRRAAGRGLTQIALSLLVLKAAALI